MITKVAVLDKQRTDATFKACAFCIIFQIAATPGILPFWTARRGFPRNLCEKQRLKYNFYGIKQLQYAFSSS